MRKSSYWRAVEPAQGTAQPEQGLESNAGDNVDAEMAQILDDVEQLFGEPVFLTLRNRAAARSFRESIESIFMSWSVREIVPGPVPSEINKKRVLYMFIL